MVAVANSTRLAYWMEKYKEGKQEELLARSEKGRTFGAWQEWTDGESGYRFFVHAETCELTWQEPEEVAQEEERQLYGPLCACVCVRVWTCACGVDSAESYLRLSERGCLHECVCVLLCVFSQ